MGHPVEDVLDLGEEDQELDWFGAGDTFEAGAWAFDFRVGGRDVAEGTFHDGPVSRYEATYTDIVEHVRIVTTYDMWLLRPVLGRRAEPLGRQPGPARGAGRPPSVGQSSSQ